MSKRLFDIDPGTGAVTTFEETETGFALHTVADVEPDLDHNKARASEPGWWAGDLRLEAHIPDIVQLKWFAEHGIKAWDPDHTPKVVKMLNSNEYRYLKCADVII